MSTAVESVTFDTLLLEERRYPPPPEFSAEANAKPDIYSRSFEEFWETEGRGRVTWFEPFTKLLEWELPYAKWYIDGKLNVCFNCVDRHVAAGNGEKIAYYWEGEPEDDRREITFAGLQRDVVRFANALKKLGVRKGTPVANDMECELLITQDEGWRAGKPVPLKRNADEALASSPTVTQTVVLRRTGGDVPIQNGRDHWWHDVVEGEPDDPESCPCEPMDAEDLLYLLYTSGTTAKPKGIVHTTAGYL